MQKVFQKTIHNSLLIILICVGYDSMAQLRLYRKLPVFETSPHYKVEVKQGTSDFTEIHAYQIKPNAGGHVTKNDQFANFGFNPAGGAVQIRVTRKDGVALTSDNSKMVNKAIKNVTQNHSGGAIILTCTADKRHIYVSVNGKTEYPLMVFVDPIADRPYPSNANVVTFAARNTPYIQTAQYDRYTIPNDVDVVVIEDGAVVQGTIHTATGRTKPLLLTGRGVILGNGEVLHGSANIPYNAVVITKGNKHIVENIMVINSRHFTIDVGKDALVDNAKMYGYDTNNDGIVGGDNSIIQNVFSKVNDDHIKLYNENMIVRDCNFWVQQNGALFQLAWNAIVPGSDCLVENSEVLAWEAGCGDPRLGQGGVARTFINLREYEGLNMPVTKNNTFKNIYVQGQLDRFIGINGKYGDSKPISLQNYVLENITIDKMPNKYAWMYTGSTAKIDFTFKNVKIAGNCLTASNYQFITEGDVKLTYLPCSTPVNVTPTVSLTAPANNTTFTAPANITLTATATGSDSTIADVTFYNGSTLLATDTTSPYSYTWTGVPVGTYTITAVATYTSGATDTTDASTIVVEAPISDINDLIATDTSCKSVSLKWGDVSQETGYRIRRKLATESTYTNIADVAANTTSYVDNTAQGDIDYMYMVRPLQNAVAVKLSNVVSVKTPPCSLTTSSGTPINQTTLVVYPSPARDYVIIKGLKTKSPILLYSLQGQLISETRNTNKIDLSNLPAGMYLIRTEGKSHKVIKE